MAILLWSIFSMLLIFFYTCNLRAMLIAREYERPMETLQDVLDKNLKIHGHQALQSQLM